jgi:hypothetical protein
MKDEVEHPGKLFCRFIGFASSNPREVSYLEFISLGAGGDTLPQPGISLGQTADLESFYKKLLKTWGSPLEFKHKNYDWKRDNESRLPGWNFLSFKNLGFRGFYPWMTEYERRTKKRRAPPKTHPNGVTRIHGAVFRVNKTGRKFFEKLIGQDAGNQIKLVGDTTLYLKSGRWNGFDQVILECKSLERFSKRYGVGKKTVFQGRPAILLKNPAKMWDILLIEK